ncbi:c-type cytochrome [Alteromonas ponticola]|uniref:Cytochrome c n=1 Tax=Alteromonas ponticola TaxID=2720613 RepID=A0ABX1QZA9_9ALTE|nr:cytochrome c [Alteromonas ponticola]NMH58838.1 cytochrome c [Alteromonas ponticola]
MKIRSKFLVVSLSALALALPVAAKVIEVKSEKEARNAVENRKALFTLMKDNMGPLGAMARGKIPYDEAVLQTNSLRLQQLGDMMYDYLLVDTRKFDVNSHAKPALWENVSDAEEKIDGFKKAANNLGRVVAAGDDSQYRNAIGQVGSACKACHDDYKDD